MNGYRQGAITAINVFGHTTTKCATNKVAHPTVVAKGTRKVGAVICKSADNKQNQFQWQVVVKRNKGSVSGENGPYEIICLKHNQFHMYEIIFHLKIY